MKKIQILIVDDDKNILDTLCKAFDLYEYELSTASIGDEACGLIEKNQYDCILLDLRLPDIDGLEIMRQHKLKNVIMITAHGTVENAVEAMKLGCVDYLRKPFDLVIVREKVRLLLERHALSFEQVLEYESMLQAAKLEIRDHQYRNAIKTVNKALELKPDSADAYNILGVLYEVLDDLPKALKAYQTAIRMDPDNDSAAANLQRIRELDDKSGLRLRF